MAPISRDGVNAPLLLEIVKSRSAPAVVQLLQEASHADVPEYGKAVQRCGELRDRDSLVQVWQLAKHRHVELDRAAYGQIITAAARTARGWNGKGLSNADKVYSLNVGKDAWAEMKQVGHIPRTPEYGAVLNLCSKAGDVEWASAIWPAALHRCGLQASLLNQFLDTMAQHGGEAGWEVVDSELTKARKAGSTINSFTLAVLLDAAANQNNFKRAESLWDSIAPEVVLNPIIFCTRAKALTVTGHEDKVPPLRAEMDSKGIQPVFRTFLGEAQALLLMIYKADVSKHMLDALHGTDKLARMQLDRQQVSPHEVRELDDMLRIAKRIASRRSVSLSEVRVLRWPWPQ